MTEPKQKSTGWIKTLFIVVVILMALSYFFKLFTPQQVPQQALLTKNFEGSTTTFEKIAYTGVISSLPNKLPIGTAENLETDPTQLESNLVQTFSLTSSQDVPGIWTGSDYSLTKVSQPLLYIITKNQQPSQKKVTDVTKAAMVAQDVLNKIIPNSNLEILSQEIAFKAANTQGDTVPQQDAELIEIPFAYTFGPYKVFLGQSVFLPARVLINSDYQVQKITIQPYTTSIKEGSSIETISIPDAIDNINHNKAALVSAFYDGPGVSSLDSIVSGTLTGVSLEYHIDPSNRSVIPYYHFSGVLTNSDNQDLQSEIITPAIQTKFE